MKNIIFCRNYPPVYPSDTTRRRENGKIIVLLAVYDSYPAE